MRNVVLDLDAVGPCISYLLVLCSFVCRILFACALGDHNDGGRDPVVKKYDRTRKMLLSKMKLRCKSKIVRYLLKHLNLFN